MGIPGNSREFPGSNFSLPGSETWENRQNPPVTDLQWTRQTRFVLWAGSGQADAPGACLTVLRYPSTRQSHWKCLSGFGEAAPARLPPDLPDSREFPPGVGVPGSSREFPTPEISLPGNCSTIFYFISRARAVRRTFPSVQNKRDATHVDAEVPRVLSNCGHSGCD